MKGNRNEIMKERARNERGYYLSQFDGVNNSEFLNEKARLFDKALGIYEKLLDNDIKGDVDLSEILSILITMYNGRPFTPIEDIDDIWKKLDLSAYRKRAGIKSIFRCSRMPLLLKCIYEDDKIIYEDHSRIQCYDISKFYRFNIDKHEWMGIDEETYLNLVENWSNRHE